MIAFSLPSPRCKRLELENSQLTENSPVTARSGRQDKWFTFYASTGLSGCRVEGSTGVLQVQRPSQEALIRPAEYRPVQCRLATIDANAAAGDLPTQHRGLIYWDAAHGGAGFLFDFGFTAAATSPGGKGEPAFHGLLQIV